MAKIKICYIVGHFKETVGRLLRTMPQISLLVFLSV